MLFGYADIEKTIGKPATEFGKTGAVGHSRRNRNDSLILLCPLYNRRSEYVGKGYRTLRRRCGRNPVVGYRIVFGRRVSPSLLRYQMNDNGSVQFLNPLKDRNHLFQIMTVQRSYIFKTQIRKKIARKNKTLYGAL